MSNRSSSKRHGMKNIKSRTPYNNKDKTSAHALQQERQDLIKQAITDFENSIA
jgi:hypothetical protein